MNDIALQVRGLTKFFGPSLVVDHLCLEVRRGEIFGFLGPNGAGKTTSITMMVGLLKPTAGEVFIEGLPVHTGKSSVLQRIGVCPQENILWDKLTCLEQLEFIGVNYGLSRDQVRRRGGDLLESLGLSAKAHELAGRLSGGMKRRLNLALALVHDPQIVFLDEPEAGLDPQSRVLVRDYIRDLARRKTVVLTTHNMDEAERLADRVAIIDHGRLLVVDTPEALKRGLGEGTILEIALADPGESQAGPDLQVVRRCFPEATWDSSTLTLRGPDITARLPALLQALQAAGCQVRDIHLRAITLEDVFLSLTGRGLRE